jgi:cobalt-zinc-cadmium efflux system outer membrane protein
VYVNKEVSVPLTQSRYVISNLFRFRTQWALMAAVCAGTVFGVDRAVNAQFPNGEEIIILCQGLTTQDGIAKARSSMSGPEGVWLSVASGPPEIQQPQSLPNSAIVRGNATLMPAPANPPMAECIPPGRTLQDGQVGLTLAVLESIALRNNPTLIQAAAHVQAAQGRWIQAGLSPNPVVGYQATEIGNNGRAGQQGAFLSQEFVRRGKLDLNRAVGSREVVQAQQWMEAQRLRVLNDVRTEYYNVLVAQRAEGLTQELAAIAQRAFEITQQLFQGKQVSKVEVMQARIESTTAAIALQNAKNRQTASWRRLSSVTGVPAMLPQKLTGDLTPPEADLEWEEVFGQLVARSPEIASARAGITRARAVLQRAQIEPLPNFDMQVGVQYDNASEFVIGNVQVGVPIPVLNRNQGNIRTAFADLRNAQAEVGRIELSLRNRLALAFEAYANASNQVKRYSREILPDAHGSLDLVVSGYRNEQVNFLTLLTAQRTFSQTNLAYLQALQDMWVNRVAIEGLLLTGSLQGEPGAINVPRVTGGAAPVFGPGKPPVEQN